MVFRLGILFSAILLGIVMLYLRRKEKWEWDRILILFIATVVCISIFGGIGIFLYMKTSAKPEMQTSFWDIHLSTGKSTIKFIKGQPNKINDEDIWIYISEVLGTPEAYFMKFKEDRLRFVGYFGGKSSKGPGIQGIKKGSSLDDIIRHFGKPPHLSESKNNANQLYSYDKYHVFFITKDNRVIIYGVYNPKYGPLTIEETIGKPPHHLGIEF